MHCWVWNAGLVLCLAGCADVQFAATPAVRAQQDAAAVTVAVTQVALWETYVAELGPNFERLSPANALRATSAFEGRFAERLAELIEGRFLVGLPRTQTQQTRIEEIDPTGRRQTQGRTERSLAAGVLPQPLAPPQNLRGPNSTEGNRQWSPSDLTASFLRYQSAAALMQEIVFLNRQFRDAALRRGYVPYVIRLQVGIRPYARNLPYDAWLTISFFTGSPDDIYNLFKGSPQPELPDGSPRAASASASQQPGLEPQHSEWRSRSQSRRLANPIILPILATDNLEGIQRSAGIELGRNIGAALGGLIEGVGLEAGIQSAISRSFDMEGRELNSLLSMGRLTDNTIQVRLGANFQPNLQTGSGSASYSIIPRTHNITLLALVNRDYLNEFPLRPQLGGARHDSADGDVPRLTLRMHWSLRHSVTGTELPSRRILSESIERISPLLPPGVLAKIDRGRTALLGRVIANDFVGFWETYRRLIQSGPAASPNDEPGPEVWAIWFALADAASRSNFHGADVELPIRNTRSH